MIKHIWSVLCGQSIIDQDSNNISLINVLEQLAVNVKPGFKYPINIAINYEIISLFTKTDPDVEEKAELKIEIENPDEKIVKSFTQNIVIAKKLLRLRSRSRISGLTMEKEGKYHFVVQIKPEGEGEFTTIARLPLDIQLKVVDIAQPNGSA